MKQRYDVILFDADRTLFDFDQSQRLALGEVYRANGIPETEENIQTSCGHGSTRGKFPWRSWNTSASGTLQRRWG